MSTILSRCILQKRKAVTCLNALQTRNDRSIAMEKEIIQFTMSNLSLYISTIQMVSERKYRNMHLHNAIELIRVEEGELDCYINDEVLHLCAKHMLLVNSLIAQRLAPTTTAQITYIQIHISRRASEDRNTALNVLAEYIGHVHNKPYGFFVSNAELSSIFDAIQYEAARNMLHRLEHS